MGDSLHALQSWFAEQCDGEWEHSYGVRIETVDNPGWAVEIDLVGTRLAGAVLPEAVHERSPADWVRCSAAGGCFKGVGGPTNLAEIIQRFLGWANAIG